MISHDYKFIYFPMGTIYDERIKNLLQKQTNSFELLQQSALIHTAQQAKYENYHAFTMVRNPFGRCYEFQQAHKDRYPTLSSLTSSLLDDQPPLRTQLAQILEASKSLPIKKIGRMEKINKDLKENLRECGLEWSELLNLPSNSPEYIQAFSENDIQIIKQYFQEDFAAFYPNFLHASDEFTASSSTQPQKNPLAEEFKKMSSIWGDIYELPSFQYINNKFSENQALPAPSLYEGGNEDADIGFVSLCTPHIYNYALPAQEILKKYCRKHNYGYHLYRDSLDKDSHPTWSKASAVLNHIKQHKWLIWIDADAVPIDFNKKISDFTDRYKRKSILGSHDIGHTNPDVSKRGALMNGGVLFFKNSSYVINILTKWRDFSLENDTPNLFSFGSDQEILSQILKKSDPTGFNYKLFPMKHFNTDPRHVEQDTFIMHFLSYPDNLKNMFINYIHNFLSNNA